METLVAPDLIWLVQGLATTLAVGLVVALWAGLMLMVRPPVVFALNAGLSRWIDTSAGFKILDQPLALERWFYRHHRPVGAAITLGASLVLWRWATAYDRAEFLAALGWTQSPLDWIVAGLEWSLVVLTVGVLAVGLVVLVRPSLLKNVERFANRWMRLLPAATALDSVVVSVDRGFETESRLLGFAVALAAGWSLAVLMPVLVHLLGR